MNTINKSELMRKAWAIASLLTGDISARLSYALKEAWEEVKTNARATLTAETVRRLLARGAKLWSHPLTGATRVYLNGLARDLLDIEVDYYKTGNLKFFSMGGYKYSNCSGKRILCSLAKTWYDPEAGRIICDDKDLAADLEAAIANI